MGEVSECGEQIERSTQATVLVVDDDARIVRLVGLMLSAEGYRVLKAHGPEEAVRIFEQKGNEIDLLLSDVMMPGMSGPELETRLHEVKPQLPVILMTGNAGHVAPPGKVLEKPFHMLDLCERVAAALGRSARVSIHPARIGHEGKDFCGSISPY
jgi:two-component system, cell cycle sensor histidine kinase and response regulator CckA